MRILLLGGNGQVGWELQRALAPLGGLRVCTRQNADLNVPGSLPTLIERERPQVIVNAAAYTAVDWAESEEAEAYRVNAEAVAVLAEMARRHGAWLVHYSTDYVFDGSKPDPYREGDPVAPLNVYGRTKLAGEEAVQASGGKHLILRTSWVYAARGNNFAKTMLRLAAERDELKVVADQVGAPTSAELIADTTALILYRLQQDTNLAREASGVYHLVASGETSWHEYARWVISQAIGLGIALKATPEQVLPIGSTDYPTTARRPGNSRLDNQKLQQTFGLRLPLWQDHARRMLAEYCETLN